jgi:hypothetical protein
VFRQLGPCKVTPNPSIEGTSANALLLAKSPSGVKAVAIFILAIGALLVYTRSPQTVQDWLVLAVASAVGGLVAFLVSCLVNLLWILTQSTERAGVTGEHLFEITEQGFREKTAQNESVQAWAGLWKPLRSRKLILVRINGYLFHVLPRRAFTDNAEYEGLTLPSRGRPQAGFAHLRPPLMSNVRPPRTPTGMLGRSRSESCHRKCAPSSAQCHSAQHQSRWPRARCFRSVQK